MNKRGASIGKQLARRVASRMPGIKPAITHPRNTSLRTVVNYPGQASRLREARDYIEYAGSFIRDRYIFPEVRDEPDDIITGTLDIFVRS